MAVYKHKRKDSKGEYYYTGKWIWEVGSGKDRKRGLEDTELEARTLEAEAKAGIETALPGPVHTVRAAVKTYLAKNPTWHPSTRSAKERVLNQFAEKYGHKVIRNVTSADCLEFLEYHATLEKKVRRLPYGEKDRNGSEYRVDVKTVPENRNKFNRFRSTLRSFFDDCRPRYDIDPTWDPLRGIKPYKKAELKQFKKEPITDEELNRLLAAALELGEEVGVGRQYHSLVIAYAFTGARKEEVLRWTWAEDISFEAGIVRLVSRKGGEREDWIPMAPPLKEALEWQLENRLPHSDYIFQIRGPSWVGTKKYGQRIRYANKLMEKLTAKAEIINGNGKLKKVTFHTLRHYFCTKLGNKVGAGLNVAEATALSRHWTKEIFFDTYVHTEKDKEASLATAFDDIEIVK